MLRSGLLLLAFFISIAGFSQQSYNDSMDAFIKNYVDKHEVVIGKNKNSLNFFPVNKDYRVIAQFEKVKDSKWFSMKTSGTTPQIHRVYGVLHFTIHDTSVTLNLYQSQDLLVEPKYKNYLFLPFTDLTSGEETYASGRYIDLTFEDIVENKVVIDFNKAYNPYCAYVSGRYNCPIPPKENNLSVAILAGEKSYNKQH